MPDISTLGALIAQFDVDLAFPFAAGLIAAFNPCGFAMLPIYVSFFMGSGSDDETSKPRNLIRALKVSLVLTLGFIIVFGAMGLLTAQVLQSSAVTRYTPWVTLILGVLFVPLGIAMLRGFELKLNTPRLQRGGDSAELGSMFMFGVSYAVVSLGCTLPAFTIAVTSTFTANGVLDGSAGFVAYAIGMGTVITALTVGIALARTNVATNMRRLLPLVNRLSGVLLILSGIYLAMYGWWEIQVFRGNITSNPFIEQFETMQTELNNWIIQTGEVRLGAGLLLILGFVLLRALWSDVPSNQRPFWVGGLGLAWVLLEFVQSWNGERANLFVLPLLRTVVSIPSRIGNWFTDPLRWGVLGEIIVLALVGLFVYRKARKYLPASDAVDATEREAVAAG